MARRESGADFISRNVRVFVNGNCCVLYGRLSFTPSLSLPLYLFVFCIAAAFLPGLSVRDVVQRAGDYDVAPHLVTIKNLNYS